MSDPVYFLHIPKTAGLSFSAVVESRFAPDRTCPARLWSELLAIPRPALGKYDLFRGHFHWALLAYLGERGLRTRVITMLRDPVERSISHFAHVRRAPEHYHHALAKTMTLRQFVEDDRTRAMIENFQARWLANRFDPVAEAVRAGDAPLALERRTDEMNTSPDGAALLDRARSTLRRCAFVGVTEAFAPSMRRLGEVMGWTLSDDELDPRLNTNPDRPMTAGLDEPTLRALRDATHVDRLIYDEVMSAVGGHPASLCPTA